MAEVTLEDRVRRLENSRYRMAGQLNAQRSLLLSAWMTLIKRGSAPPEKVLAQMRQAFLANARQNSVSDVSIDELEAYHQEYVRSLESFLSELEKATSRPFS